MYTPTFNNMSQRKTNPITFVYRQNSPSYAKNIQYSILVPYFHTARIANFGMFIAWWLPALFITPAGPQMQ